MRDLGVLYLDNEKRVNQGFNEHAEILHDHDVLVQKIIKLLLTEFQTNYYDPNTGSDYATLVGRPFNDGDDTSEVKVFILNSVKRVEMDIKTSQIGNSLLSPSEKLTSLSVTNIIYNKAETKLEVFIQVGTESGTTTVVRV